jgi:hypothetical protein
VLLQAITILHIVFFAVEGGAVPFLVIIWMVFFPESEINGERLFVHPGPLTSVHSGTDPIGFFPIVQRGLLVFLSGFNQCEKLFI